MGIDARSDLERARSAVRALVERQNREALAAYEPLGWHESLAGSPVLNLDDFSAIPFLVDIGGVEEYQHRARLRAADGDLFAAGTPQNEVYENYCRERLTLGRAEFMSAPNDRNPLALAEACSSGASFERLVSRAEEAGGLVIHPFMGIESVWELGRRIAVESGQPVGMLAPPPPVTWVANDKAAFGEVVTRVLGADYLVETRRSSSPEALARDLVALARRHRRVALKRLRCASAMGNAVFEASSLAELEAAAVEAEVLAFLERTEWDGEEVLAVAWEETELSPSTQLWIPPAGGGEPRLDGIYEQLLRGERRVFVGSRPSTLPAKVNQELESASVQVAAGLQELGYVGRCSFDFLVLGNPPEDFSVRFVECNGRWGGTSTPMALLDRLLAGPRPPYRAQDFVHPGLVGAPFGDILSAVGKDLFDAGTGRGRFIFYNVGPLARLGKLNVIALGGSQEEAEAAIEEDLPRLLGLHQP
ncbi:MAG: hypothetical protein GY769_03530 [bacterium]|nr:hypothetical protein [bacterium]